MVDGQAGKGDTYRPVDREKYRHTYECIAYEERIASLRRALKTVLRRSRFPSDHAFVAMVSSGGTAHNALKRDDKAKQKMEEKYG
jgi:hypothetical protein